MLDFIDFNFNKKTIKTDFIIFDSLIDYKENDIIQIIGKSAVGKTAFVSQLLSHLTKNYVCCYMYYDFLPYIFNIYDFKNDLLTYKLNIEQINIENISKIVKNCDFVIIDDISYIRHQDLDKIILENKNDTNFILVNQIRNSFNRNILKTATSDKMLYYTNHILLLKEAHRIGSVKNGFFSINNIKIPYILQNGKFNEIDFKLNYEIYKGNIIKTANRHYIYNNVEYMSKKAIKGVISKY